MAGSVPDPGVRVWQVAAPSQADARAWGLCHDERCPDRHALTGCTGRVEMVCRGLQRVVEVAAL